MDLTLLALLVFSVYNLYSILKLQREMKLVLTGVQKGDANRKWKGYWKVHPNDYENIGLDPRPAHIIAKDYNCSLSWINKIKRDYKIRHSEGKEIVKKYYAKQK